MTGEQRWGLWYCALALLGRKPSPGEWAQFVETWHWLEFENGKPKPSTEEWEKWMKQLESKQPVDRKESGEKSDEGG